MSAGQWVGVGGGVGPVRVGEMGWNLVLSLARPWSGPASLQACPVLGHTRCQGLPHV